MGRVRLLRRLRQMGPSSVEPQLHPFGADRVWQPAEPPLLTGHLPAHHSHSPGWQRPIALQHGRMPGLTPGPPSPSRIRPRLVWHTAGIGNPVISPVTNGVAAASYTLPAGAPVKSYTVAANYSGGVKFNRRSSGAVTLAINPDTVAPTLIITSPTNGQITGSRVVVRGRVIDDEGGVWFVKAQNWDTAPSSPAVSVVLTI